MSVTGRLLVLVLVPLIGMVALLAGGMQTRAKTSRSATRVTEGVKQVQELVALRSAVARERFYTEWIAGARATGVTVESVSALVGVDLAARHDAAVRATDAQLASLGGNGRLITPAELATARQQVGGTVGTGETLTDSYVPIEQRIDDAKAQILAGLRPELDMVGGHSLSIVFEAIRTEMAIASSVKTSLRASVLMFVGSRDLDGLLRQIVVAQAVEARAFEELGRSGQPEVVEAAARLARHPATEGFRAAMESYLQGDIPRFGEIEDSRRMATIAIAGIDQMSATFDLLDTSSELASGIAAAREAEARRDLMVWTGSAGTVGVVSLVVSVLLARSITRPLRRLRDHAGTLSVGEVQVDPLPPGGPRDIEVTSHAFNDLVGNLRLLEAKVLALADLDFEAEALAQPLPGSLGRSLQRSQRALSGSISERDELRSHILHQASHDDLTSLPNRNAAIEELDQALARSRRVGRGVGVMHLDIDEFKRINDIHGHTFGDAVLIDIAHRLDRAATGSSLVARIGGDEFLVLVEDLDEPEPMVDAARRLVAQLGRPSQVDGVAVAMSVCAGVGFSWDGKASRDELLVRADLAVARAKQRGRGSVEIHDRALQEQLVAQAAIEEALVTALRSDDELFLQYQPVVELDGGTMSSAEALVRWNRPGTGIAAPDSFIPVAERSNLIIDLDRWVMARAAHQLDRWSHHPHMGAVDVAVNVSGCHLTNQSLYDHVRDLLDVSGVDPSRLIVEITETALVEDLVMAAAQLEAVRRLGVRIALDDFGTGYTSIAHLRRLPVDIIKIDRSFVQRLNRDIDRALLRMITELGHRLGAVIVAEGVETAEQYETLRALGCDRAQGYHLSRPVAPGDLERWAAEQHEARRARPPSQDLGRDRVV